MKQCGWRGRWVHTRALSCRHPCVHPVHPYTILSTFGAHISFRMERHGTMHLQPPLPDSSEPPRQPRITQRLWDDWDDRDDETQQLSNMATVQAGMFHTDATEKHPLGVVLTRPFSWLDAWADDQETLASNAIHASSPLSERPFGVRRSVPY